MTEIRQWCKMYCHILGSSSKFSQVSVILCPLLLQLHVPNWSSAVNYFFFLQSDLLEFSVEFLTYVVSWIPLLPLMHVIFDLGSSFLLRVVPCLLSVLLQDIAGTVGTFNFFRAFLTNSLNSKSQDQWSNFFSVFLHYRASIFHLSNFTFPSFSSSLILPLQISDKKWSDLDVTCRFVSRPPHHMYLSGGFSFFNKVNCVKTVQENQANLLIHRCSNNHRCDFPAFWMSIPGDVNIFQWVVFHRLPEMSLENVVVVEMVLILQGNLDDVLLELEDPVSRWIFSIPDLFQKVWFVHLGLEKMNFSFSFLCIESFHHGFWCVHLFQLLKVRNQYVSFPNSPRIQDIIEEYSRNYFLSKLMDSRLTFCGNRMIFNQGTKWKDWSLKWFFNACVLRTPQQHTRLVIEGLPGTNIFPPTDAF